MGFINNKNNTSYQQENRSSKRQILPEKVTFVLSNYRTMPIQYIGEHLFPGQAGHFFVWLGFATALLATVFYALAYYRRKGNLTCLRSARAFYLIHLFSLIMVAGLLYWLIFKHYYEYAYVWEYSSTDLAIKYIISCFWAGQEGSFLVWALAQAIIGGILLKIARNWESPVMMTFSLSQAFITSMLLGVEILGIKIGSSPFKLLRETLDTVQGTIFVLPDYLKHIPDGNGLNPLLENIWMTIHPPVLFIGYALALVPFCYAIASLFKKDYYTWISRSFPWTLLALLMLSAGILLGGAWAYVSLTFGGFWSWDPVENSSLVPWMTLVAALHFMIISRRQNYALLLAYVFTPLTYVLVLYASFLTRSGVLADTSAHSFGDNGMSVQLLFFMLTFLLIMTINILGHLHKITFPKKDVLLSREFWMFIGSIIMVLASFQILFTTSIPVFNALTGSDIAPPNDRVGFYNRWQMPYALLIAGFIAFSQFLNYDSNDSGKFLRKLLLPVCITLVICFLMFFSGVVIQFNYLLFLFFIVFALVASLTNLIIKTSRQRNMPAIATHLGFILFLLGTLITFSNSRTISSNTSRYDLGDARSNEENLMLVKGDTLYMEGFYVVYSSRWKSGNTTAYAVDFLKKDGGKFYKAFTLHPSINQHPRMGAVYNPDTRHYLNRDYYTYISAVGSEPEYIVIKAIMNPYINLLWAGCLLMGAGFGWAFLRRVRRRWVSR